MPTLDWMGKDKVVDYYHQVPYRILTPVPERGVLDSHGSDCGNMVIHGDNLDQRVDEWTFGLVLTNGHQGRGRGCGTAGCLF